MIREHLYRAQRMRLEIELAELGSGLKPETRQRLGALAARFDEEEKRYAVELRGSGLVEEPAWEPECDLREQHHQE
jgi:hypothetical protein